MTGRRRTEASDDYVQRTASALAAAGFPRMPANVLMTLMGSETGELTAEQIADRLGVSAAAVSGGVRYLETIGIARRNRAPGERRYVWELAEHPWYASTLGRNPLFDHIIEVSTRELAGIDPASPVHERIAEMQDFMVFARDALPKVLEDWLAARAERDRG